MTDKTNEIRKIAVGDARRPHQTHRLWSRTCNRKLQNTCVRKRHILTAHFAMFAVIVRPIRCARRVSSRSVFVAIDYPKNIVYNNNNNNNKIDRISRSFLCLSTRRGGGGGECERGAKHAAACHVTARQDPALAQTKRRYCNLCAR